MLIVDEDKYLEHYGVIGMKWGKRKKSDDSNKTRDKNEQSLKSRFSERQIRIKEGEAAILKARAITNSLRVSKLNKELAALPPGMKTQHKKYALRNEITISEQAAKKNLEQAEKTKKARLTPTQKKVLIGAAVVGAVVVAAHLNRTGGEDIASAIRRARSMQEHGTIFKINKDLADKSLSAEEVLTKVAKTVNPKYSSPGGKMNCRRATFAYELRRRGYQVDATPSAIGRGQSETGLVNALIRGDRDVNRSSGLSTMIIGGEGIRGRAAPRDTRAYSAFTKTIKDFRSDVPKLREALREMPDGARGEVVFNERGFGHSMAWEIIKGQAHIFDTQKGQRFPVTPEGLTNLTNKWGIPAEIGLTRLDNVDLDLKFLSRWAANSS